MSKAKEMISRNYNISQSDDADINRIENLMLDYSEQENKELRDEVEMWKDLAMTPANTISKLKTQLAEKEKMIEGLRTSLACSERFRLEDAGSHNDEKIQDWERIKKLQSEIDSLRELPVKIRDMVNKSNGSIRGNYCDFNELLQFINSPEFKNYLNQK